MMRNKALKSAVLNPIFIAQNHLVFAESVKERESFRRHSVGSSFFITLNLAPNPPYFHQLNYAYRIKPKNIISAEAKASTYDATSGIPHYSSYILAREDYPGSEKSAGLTLAFK